MTKTEAQQEADSIFFHMAMELSERLKGRDAIPVTELAQYVEETLKPWTVQWLMTSQSRETPNVAG